MFRFSHYVAAIFCAVVFVASNPEHNSSLRERLAAADRELVAAMSDAVAVVRLTPEPAKSAEVTVTYKGGEWVMEPSQ
jgi:hypothetical protein